MPAEEFYNYKCEVCGRRTLRRSHMPSRTRRAARLRAGLRRAPHGCAEHLLFTFSRIWGAAHTTVRISDEHSQVARLWTLELVLQVQRVAGNFHVSVSMEDFFLLEETQVWGLTLLSCTTQTRLQRCQGSQ